MAKRISQRQVKNAVSQFDKYWESEKKRESDRLKKIKEKK